MNGGLATMWTSFSRRSFLLLSLRFSSSSRTPSPYAVRTSQFLSSCNYSSRTFPRLEGLDSVRVSVWWNSDICSLPAGVKVTGLARAVTATVRDEGINIGPIEFNAFGDIVQRSRENGEDLRCPEIKFVDVPEVGKQRNRTDKILLWEVVKWVEKHPPPALLVFIYTGSYLYDLFRELRMRDYDTMSLTQDTPDDSSSSSDEMSIEDLPKSALKEIHRITKANPEDLPLLNLRKSKKGGYYVCVAIKKSPDDSSVSSDVCSEVPIVEVSSDSDCAPKSVLKQILHVLKSHPDGILLDSLRRELVMDDWKFNKKYYDIWLLSRFILSFPETLQLEARVDGTFVTSV